MLCGGRPFGAVSAPRIGPDFVGLLAFYEYRIPAREVTLRFGGGARYHIGGGVRESGSLEGLDFGIDNALGGSAEVSVVYGILSGGLRYTPMRNSVEGISAPLNASSVGLFLGLTTPRNYGLARSYFQSIGLVLHPKHAFEHDGDFFELRLLYGFVPSGCQEGKEKRQAKHADVNQPFPPVLVRLRKSV